MRQFATFVFQRKENLASKSGYLTRNDWIIIIAGWLITQAAAYTIYGINNQEEALTHISFAESFINGTAKLELRRLWYAGYIALLVLVRTLNLPYESLYVLQLILSFISLVYFVKIVSLWSASRLTLILSGLLYATCFLIQKWVTHLFTDAIFSFLLVIATYYLLTEHKSRHGKIIFWSLLIILPFFRPVGFLFIPVACLHWLFTYNKANLKKIVAASVYLVFLLLLIYRAIVINSGYFYPFNNLDAEIICGLPSGLLQYQVVPYSNDTVIAEYFWNNPGMTARLFLYRLYKVFWMTRPYFSSTHNIVIAVACIVYYSLALVGIFHLLKRRLKEKYFLLAGILIFSIPSVIFCVEWHGRMSMPSMCFVLLLSSIGIRRVSGQ